MITAYLEVRSGDELAALIQALLTAAGHEVYVESPEQTPVENLLRRATMLRDSLMHAQAAADVAGEDAVLGSS